MIVRCCKRGLVVIDEIQRDTALFPVIRVLVDRPDNQARFLLPGSAAPGLVRGTSGTLAGRTAFVDMGGFTLSELGAEARNRLWYRGGFPLSYLAKNDELSTAWREDFIRTFLERDIPQFGITVSSSTLRRFWTMIAHYHGNLWNAAEFARSLGNSEKTPAIIWTSLQGASWEGYAIEQILTIAGTRDAYFRATYTGAELDLLIFRNGQRLGFEMKCSDAPTLTRSMSIALQDLSLDALYVIYPGTARYPLTERVEALPLVVAMDLAGTDR